MSVLGSCLAVDGAAAAVGGAVGAVGGVASWGGKEGGVSSQPQQVSDQSLREAAHLVLASEKRQLEVLSKAKE